MVVPRFVAADRDRRRQQITAACRIISVRFLVAVAVQLNGAVNLRWVCSAIRSEPVGIQTQPQPTRWFSERADS